MIKKRCKRRNFKVKNIFTLKFSILRVVHTNYKNNILTGKDTEPYGKKLLFRPVLPYEAGITPFYGKYVWRIFFYHSSRITIHTDSLIYNYKTRPLHKPPWLLCHRRRSHWSDRDRPRTVLCLPRVGGIATSGATLPRWASSGPY